MRSITELPYGLPGTVYRSPMPFSPMFDPGGIVLRDYLAARVEIIVMLTSVEEAAAITRMDLPKLYGELGYTLIQSPVTDFSVPEGDGFLDALRGTWQAVKDGRTVAVHCHAGLGRTGIFAACLAKKAFGWDGEKAVTWLRRYIPGAVENRSQLQFINEFDPNSI